MVKDVADELGWKVQHSHDSHDWDVSWTDSNIDNDVLIRMHIYQKINHYPGIQCIARKNMLGIGLMNMRKKLPS